MTSTPAPPMTMDELPERCCGRCAYWNRAKPDDLTAPEGKCILMTDPGVWPTGYWPNTLQRDRCGEFNTPADADQIERIEEEERQQEREDNGQFGAGA